MSGTTNSGAPAPTPPKSPIPSPGRFIEAVGERLSRRGGKFGNASLPIRLKAAKDRFTKERVGVSGADLDAERAGLRALEGSERRTRRRLEALLERRHAEEQRRYAVRETVRDGKVVVDLGTGRPVPRMGMGRTLHRARCTPSRPRIL